ncbi:MAG: glycolate oxidase [Deltaproteobacteria bacterium]|nr:MAG: glycolate oxidase [Deltaproteobacteria bacterium]
MRAELREIIEVVGEDFALSSVDELKRFSVDGKTPRLVVFPRSVEEISEILKIAFRSSTAITPWGGGTKIGLGRIPDRVDVVICTTNINSVSEYEAADLVCTTQCGIQLRKLQEILRVKRQFLAVDPPHLEAGATIGGIIVTNDSGPRRQRFGALKELLLGIKVVRADGKVVKGGAKVVKNVAGYDIPKLYVGSLGTLGIVVEATFRLYPIAEFSQTCIISSPDIDALEKNVFAVLNSTVVPTCLELVSPPLLDRVSGHLGFDIPKKGYALCVRVESVQRAVRDQISRICDMCGGSNAKITLIEGGLEEKLWDCLINFPWKFLKDGRLVCKASILPGSIKWFLRGLEQISSSLHLDAYVLGRAGSGVLTVSLESREDDSSLVDAVSLLRKEIRVIGGNLTVWDCPLSMKSRIDVWDDIGESIGIMKRIKRLLDPRAILNPGRFVGGI